MATRQHGCMQQCPWALKSIAFNAMAEQAQLLLFLSLSLSLCVSCDVRSSLMYLPRRCQWATCSKWVWHHVTECGISRNVRNCKIMSKLTAGNGQSQQLYRMQQQQQQQAAGSKGNKIFTQYSIKILILSLSLSYTFACPAVLAIMSFTVSQPLPLPPPLPPPHHHPHLCHRKCNKSHRLLMDM